MNKQNITVLFEAMCFALLACVMLAPKANAYIDPTTGSFMLEVTLGYLFAALIGIKCAWRSVFRHFGR